MFLDFPYQSLKSDFIFYTTIHINSVNIKSIALKDGGYRLWIKIN